MKRLASLLISGLMLLTGCSGGESSSAPEPADALTVTGHMQLDYAEQFTVDHCAGGESIVTIGEDKFLLVNKGEAPPEGAEGMTVISVPVSNIYNAASSTLDLFDALGHLSAVRLTSTKPESWSLPNIRKAMEDGSLTYVGKYSAPDYELAAASGTELAIESTMIYHSPEVKEKLETLGIPVLVEHSSYESHPLGRMEWIKLYGLLLGIPDEAESWFSSQTDGFSQGSDIPESERKTAVFFYISPNGYVNIRKPSDYVARMIELAGGRYAFTAEELNVDENALSTMNIQLEEFYEKAKDADVLIYNSTVEGEIGSISELTAKSSILADMKAVKNGSVWCSGQNMFQQTTGAADMIRDLEKIFSGESSELRFLRKLQP